MRNAFASLTALSLPVFWAGLLSAQQLTYQPYIMPGDNGPFGPADQIVVAWQTNETTPVPQAYSVDFGVTNAYGATVRPQARVVNNYLAADKSIPVPPSATGPKSNYTAVLTGLTYDTAYFYRVTGPGIAQGGFTAGFRTRTKGGQFSFLVQGDEGYFPDEPGTPRRVADFEARIVHLMQNAQNISFPNQAQRPQPYFAINTGDNVYNQGSEGSYRDYWFPVWNSNTDSNQSGAPFLRSTPLYIVVGNHDTGGNGDFVNMLGQDGAGSFTGTTEGGDALAYYNNYYYPLNGPAGVDSQYVFSGDAVGSNGWFFTYGGKTYSSPAAAEAYRASTAADTGHGVKRQIDHMSNYSFDSGNAHFVFLDADPHLFNALVDFSPTFSSPAVNFPDYPTILRNWIVRDLDSSKQTWKIVVMHHPPFSSGNATIRNFQMRRIAKVLEDHGVNLVFNGHEHNYQRTLPIRALPRVAEVPDTNAEPAVEADTKFDGGANAVPDGVMYVVEGAGGNRDFDGGLPTPRGQGSGLDEDDSTTGTFSYGTGLVFGQGPQAWLDSWLTNNEMAPFLSNAGAGQKITAKFKAKLFSFAHVVVNGPSLTLYQISEPLLGSSSATAQNQAPYGTDVNGQPVNDPIPDTLVDPATGSVVSQPTPDGPPALLDKFTITKPDVSAGVLAGISCPDAVVPGGALNCQVRVDNFSGYPLNGVQAVVTLPAGVEFDGTIGPQTTLSGKFDVVLTLGRIVPGERRVVTVPARVAEATGAGSVLRVFASVRSATALPVDAGSATTPVFPIPLF